nr:MAG TPA: hypothetical protein [Caudoviricetes sp.]
MLSNARFFFALTVTKVTTFECVREPKKCLYGLVVILLYYTRIVICIKSNKTGVFFK